MIPATQKLFVILKISLSIFNHFVEKRLRVNGVDSCQGVVYESLECGSESFRFSRFRDKELIVYISCNERVNTLGNWACEYGLYVIRGKYRVGFHNRAERKIRNLSLVREVYVGDKVCKTDGLISLREAISYANEGDTVTFGKEIPGGDTEDEES